MTPENLSFTIHHLSESVPQGMGEGAGKNCNDLLVFVVSFCKPCDRVSKSTWFLEMHSHHVFCPPGLIFITQYDKKSTEAYPGHNRKQKPFVSSRRQALAYIVPPENTSPNTGP